MVTYNPLTVAFGFYLATFTWQYGGDITTDIRIMVSIAWPFKMLCVFQ